MNSLINPFELLGLNVNKHINLKEVRKAVLNPSKNDNKLYQKLELDNKNIIYMECVETYTEDQILSQQYNYNLSKNWKRLFNLSKENRKK